MMSSPSREDDTTMSETEKGLKVENVSARIELSFTSDNSGSDLKFHFTKNRISGNRKHVKSSI